MELMSKLKKDIRKDGGVYLNVEDYTLSEIFYICNKFGGELDHQQMRIYFVRFKNERWKDSLRFITKIR